MGVVKLFQVYKVSNNAIVEVNIRSFNWRKKIVAFKKKYIYKKYKTSECKLEVSS